jgi:hypothetical protein
MGSRIGGPFNYRSEEFRCPKCGRPGTIISEPTPPTKNSAAQFIEVIGDFYERIGNTPPYPIELVCHSCGDVQQAATIPGFKISDIPSPPQDDAS